MHYKKQKHLSYKETVRFHGHDGPFLALGYRLGRFLIKKLKPKGIMDLQITVRTRIQKPYTCVLDGLQCSTFATVGKGNLVVEGHRKKDVVVRVQKGRMVIAYRMSSYAWDICLNEEDLHSAARRILRASIPKIWPRDNRHVCNS
jgi:formylmethanofuran dehydrogenase subunit E